MDNPFRGACSRQRKKKSRCTKSRSVNSADHRRYAVPRLEERPGIITPFFQATTIFDDGANCYKGEK
jgi:hypothetical protein